MEDLLAARHPRVVSIDSAVPLRLTTDFVLSEDPGKRPKDWWDTVTFNYNMIEASKAIDDAINDDSIERGQMERFMRGIGDSCMDAVAHVPSRGIQR